MAPVARGGTAKFAPTDLGRSAHLRGPSSRAWAVRLSRSLGLLLRLGSSSRQGSRPADGFAAIRSDFCLRISVRCVGSRTTRFRCTMRWRGYQEFIAPLHQNNLTLRRGEWKGECPAGRNLPSNRGLATSVVCSVIECASLSCATKYHFQPTRRAFRCGPPLLVRLSSLAANPQSRRHFCWAESGSHEWNPRALQDHQ
jgi:hypothetical protein